MQKFIYSNKQQAVRCYLFTGLVKLWWFGLICYFIYLLFTKQSCQQFRLCNTQKGTIISIYHILFDVKNAVLIWFEALSWNLYGTNDEKPQNSSFRMVDILAEIWTRHLTNTRQMCFHFGKFICWLVCRLIGQSGRQFMGCEWWGFYMFSIFHPNNIYSQGKCMIVSSLIHLNLLG